MSGRGRGGKRLRLLAAAAALRVLKVDEEEKKIEQKLDSECKQCG